MSFLVLEGGAVLLAFLLGCEWYSQRRSWLFIALGALIVLAVLNAMIIGWRGL